MRLIVLLLVVTFLFGCNGGATSGEILSKKKMQQVWWDIIKADVYTTQILRHDALKGIDTVNIKLQQQIFDLHKVSKESFYKSYAYYKDHPNEMQVILDSMAANKMREDRFKFSKPYLKR
ncbi:DUF4296 domain-containing protein [Ferruginibacter sp. SUN002]|uniref:DUF4296 domain-containing protein n=1 Tax=Ferruginibacter sp. SUN002 TaxID=2937789 RepID=UPI003D363C3C